MTHSDTQICLPGGGGGQQGPGGLWSQASVSWDHREDTHEFK